MRSFYIYGKSSLTNNIKERYDTQIWVEEKLIVVLMVEKHQPKGTPKAKEAVPVTSPMPKRAAQFVQVPPVVFASLLSGFLIMLVIILGNINRARFGLTCTIGWQWGESVIQSSCRSWRSMGWSSKWLLSHRSILGLNECAIVGTRETTSAKSYQYGTQGPELSYSIWLLGLDPRLQLQAIFK